MIGAEVWVKLVDADQIAPIDPAAVTVLNMTTRRSFRAAFEAWSEGTTATVGPS